MAPAPEGGVVPEPPVDRAPSDPAPSDPAPIETVGADRMRSLIQASAAVVEELDLTAVLRRIAEAGMDLANARYGALGVIAPDGSLEQFIHVGIDDALAAQIGDLPTGHGVLGALIHDQQPIRIHDVAQDARSAGFPDHHPPMRTFLGVPVRVRGEMYGNLYLTDRRDGDFTAEDEELLTALAATAGIAIDNARLFEESRRRQRWSAAAAEVSAALVSAHPDAALALIAERVTALADADVVCVLLPTGEHSFFVDVARGEASSGFEGVHLPRVGLLSNRAFDRAQPVVADEPTPDGFLNAGGFATEADGTPITFGPTMAIPLAATHAPTGVLLVVRRRGRQRFSTADLDMAADFASQASVALEIARGRADGERLALLQDRSRIARDLHDHVIQRLFAAGLGLQVTSNMVDDERIRSRISTEIGSLDAAISEIRTAIFAMTANPTRRPSLRHRIIDTVGEATPGLASAPSLSFAGAVDLLVPDAMADDAVAVVREALANVARHAHASTTAITVVADDQSVIIEIIDDGIGMPDVITRASGTRNLAHRAQSWGGTCTIERADAGGTRVRWMAPLPGEAQSTEATPTTATPPTEGTTE